MFKDPLNRSYQDIEIGDFFSFSKTFKKGDVEIFSQLSDDRNPLHIDPAYAKLSSFKKNIVPAQLVAAPLSMIAGMVFPGLTSLYLSSEIAALCPVFVGDKLNYSAQVVSKSDIGSILVIRVIVFSKSKIFFKAKLKVQVQGNPSPPANKQRKTIKIKNNRDQKLALITGASGAIGSSISIALAKSGWELILHYNKSGKKIEDLARRLSETGKKFSLLKADLSYQSGVNKLASEVKNKQELSTIIHTASPSLDSSLSKQLAINFTSFKNIVSGSLDQMLRCQKGLIIQIGSSSIQLGGDGIDDYIASKSAATVYTAQLNEQFRGCGIQAITIAPGYVDTDYSKSLRGSASPALLREEVAEIVASTVNRAIVEESKFNYLWLRPGSSSEGYFGFYSGDRKKIGAIKEKERFEGQSHPGKENNIRDRLLRVSNSLQGTEEMYSSHEGSGFSLEGLDSFGQIELFLALESEFGIKFESNDFVDGLTFDLIEEKIRSKIF